MSILYLEGFEDNLYERRATAANLDISGTYGLNGNGARVGDSYTAGLNVPCPTDHYIFGIAFKLVVATSGEDLVQLNGTSVYLDYYGSRIRLHVHGSATPHIDWYSPTVSIGDWHYVEVELLYGATSDGTVKYWFDGALIASTTTHDFAAALPNTINVGGFGSSAYIDEMHVDNIYVCDALGGVNDTALGPIEIVSLLPSGNGNSSVMVGSDADSTDNYLLVDNNASAPPATTEYVGSDTEGDLDTYAMGDLTGTPTVVGMVTSLYAAKTDSGVKFIRPIVRTNSIDYVGDSTGLSESYSLHEHTWDQDPDTSATWLYGAINGMEVGQEVRDS